MKEKETSRLSVFLVVLAVCLVYALGGGIRSMEDLAAVFVLGVSRCVIGSAAVSKPEFVKEAVEVYGEKIAVGIDAMDGIVKTDGWIEDSGLKDLDFAKSMEALGVQTIIYTDIATDGALSGPNLIRLGELRKAVACQITASGGVSCNADITALKAAGMDGTIIGKAYYAGTIDLGRAVQEAK